MVEEALGVGQTEWLDLQEVVGAVFQHLRLQTVQQVVAVWQCGQHDLDVGRQVHGQPRHQVGVVVRQQLQQQSIGDIGVFRW